MTHPNPRIQKNLDLWQKIKEYDQHAAKNPPILSKKQKQMLKKHEFDGNALYRTRFTVEASPPAQ